MRQLVALFPYICSHHPIDVLHCIYLAPTRAQGLFKRLTVLPSWYPVVLLLAIHLRERPFEVAWVDIRYVPLMSANILFISSRLCVYTPNILHSIEPSSRSRQERMGAGRSKEFTCDPKQLVHLLLLGRVYAYLPIAAGRRLAPRMLSP